AADTRPRAAPGPAAAAVRRSTCTRPRRSGSAPCPRGCESAPRRRTWRPTRRTRLPSAPAGSWHSRRPTASARWRSSPDRPGRPRCQPSPLLYGRPREKEGKRGTLRGCPYLTEGKRGTLRGCPYLTEGKRGTLPGCPCLSIGVGRLDDRFPELRVVAGEEAGAHQASHGLELLERVQRQRGIPHHARHALLLGVFHPVARVAGEQDRAGVRQIDQQ